MKQLKSFIASFIQSGQFPTFFFVSFAAILLISFTDSTNATSRLLLGGLLFLGSAVLYRVHRLTSSSSSSSSSVFSEKPAVHSSSEAHSSAQPPLASVVKPFSQPVPQVQGPQPIPAASQKHVPIPAIHEAGIIPTCAFLFNTNSANPSTFIIPDLASSNSLIMVPKELSQFYNNSVMDVMRHDNPVKILRPVNKEYRKMIKAMALNDTKTVIDNGSLILPIHFFSNN